MRKRIVVALIGVLMAAGCVTAVAGGPQTPVECVIADNTLSCPLPAPVTETVTATPAQITVTPDPVTVTVTASSSTPTSPTPTSSSTTAPSSTAPSAPTTPPPAAGWPDAANTGVPAGVTLTPYTGSCLIQTPGTVIDGKTLTCTVLAYAPGVIIRNSRVNGAVYLDSDRPESKNWSVTIENSVVDAGSQNGAAVSNGNITIRRSEIKGGQTIVQCMEHSVGCTIEDSWLHGQSIPPMQGEPHLGGFLNSGGPNVTLRHNRIACDNPNGCTGDVVQLPDFGPITNALVENNLLMANDKLAYCTYAGWRLNNFATQNTGIVYRGNVFQRGSNSKCGAYGPVTGWRDNPGNAWENNVWDDGTPVTPAG